jgi:hypothetical protein
MRKVFWCCAALAVSMAAALYLVTERANSSARVISRAVVTAGGLRSTLHSVTAGGAEESAPAASNAMGAQVVAVPSKGYIVVDGNGEASATPQGVFEPGQRFDPTTIDLAALPGGGEEHKVAPPVMPACDDPNDAPPMPYADEEAKAEAEGDLSGFWQRIFGVAGGAETAPGGSEDAEQPAGCMEPASHYHHCPCCPYSGKPCYPCTPSAPEPTKKPGAKEEPSTDAQGGPVQSTSRKVFELLHPDADAKRPPRSVDTMECRPTDLIPPAVMPGAF